jgi:hypothetical protein
MLVPQGSIQFMHSLGSKEKNKHKESSEDHRLWKKAQKAIDEHEEVRKSNELKASIVTIEKGGCVSRAFKGKVTWDD